MLDEAIIEKMAEAAPVGQEDAFQAFMRQTRRFPMLEGEEERDLARRWRDHRDAVAAEKLVGSHLRLVAKIARGYRGYGLPIGELIAQGNVGLMQALQKYDPEREVRFATYASWWIKAAIQEYVLHSWSSVKMGTTAAQKKLFFNLARIKAELGLSGPGDLTNAQVEAIAERLGVPDYEVVTMNGRLAGRDQSLNVPLAEDSDSDRQDWLPDEEQTPEERVGEREERQRRSRMLEGAMTELDRRQRHIVRERRLKEPPTTLEALAQVYGISRERVRQIENQAFGKLQQAVIRQEREERKAAPLPQH